MTEQATSAASRPALRLFAWWVLFVGGSALGLIYGATLTGWFMSAGSGEALRSCSGLGCVAARVLGLLSFVAAPALLLMLKRGLRPSTLLSPDVFDPVMAFIVCLLLAVMTSSFHQLWTLPSVR